MRMKIKLYVYSLGIAAALLFNQRAAVAQQSPNQSDMTIDATTRTAVIEGALKRLNDFYVFPETAKKMEQAVRERIARKEYDQITSAKALVAAIQNHLQEVSHDKHLRMMYSAEALPPERLESDDHEPGPEELSRQLEFMRTVNFGFEKVERLPGNVGYIDLRGFQAARYGAETVVAAMNFLANTDALIIDLRRNGGGGPAMVALISGYLFGPEPVHLNHFYYRPHASPPQSGTP